jgi:LPLT family lysophospholipid transporter-like MFS transporter
MQPVALWTALRAVGMIGIALERGTHVMEDRTTTEMRLLSHGMLALLAAQFLSALADNAIFVAAIASLKLLGQDHMEPALQGAFVLSFIVLAPFAGPFADTFPKGYVMLVSNLLKLLGAWAMALGVDPFMAYGLIGVGATLYSPAKYGILTQMFGPAQLVRANGLMESSTIVAILSGVVAGGLLSDFLLSSTFAGVIACYGLAAFANLFIPHLPAEKPGASFHPWLLVRQFRVSLVTLFSNGDARFSLLGTSIFWGSGVTLRLMLFAWVPVALLIADNRTPSLLMGAVSVGIVLGAGAAGAWVTLASVNRALVGGLLLGPAVMVLALVHDVYLAGAMMVVIGACSGWFVVPLNALLQESGHKSIGAGQALAVQNFFENFAMLALVGLYWVSTLLRAPVLAIAAGFGLFLLLLIGALSVARQRQSRSFDESVP